MLNMINKEWTEMLKISKLDIFLNKGCSIISVLSIAEKIKINK